MTMSSSPLFFDPTPVEYMEKEAGEADLSEDPNQWPQEILQELYKQVPYISDFQPHVEMNKVDAEQGYGIGHVEIRNETEAPTETDPAALEATGVRMARIPFTIKQGKLSPFDLLITDTSSIVPLTENRLRQAVFRPQAFDVTSRTPGDQSMIGQLYPPYRQNYGFGGGGVSMNAGGGMGMGKIGSAFEEFIELTEAAEKSAAIDPTKPTQAKQLASAPKGDVLSAAKSSKKVKTGSVLEAILHTINRADHENFCLEVEKCASALFANREVVYESVEKIVSAEPDALSKTAQWEGWVRPSVVQIQRVSDGYLIKEASHLFWEPKSAVVDRGELVERFGVKIATDVDTSGAVTLADGAAAEATEETSQLAPVTDFGYYKVKDELGREHVGFVVPHLIDVDGTPLPLQLFTNGSVSAVQADIMGEPAGAGGNLPSGKVGGHGAFYTTDGTGKMHMTVPLELGASSAMPGEPTVYQGETFDGRPVEVSVQPNIQTVMGTPEGRMLVPQNWAWLPLTNSQAVGLVGGDEAVVEGQTEQEFEEKKSQVTVRSDGQVFSFSGEPVAKLAYAQREMLSLDEAMFLLAGLGTHQGYGAEKLAHAVFLEQPVRIQTGRELELKSELVKQAQDKAAEFLQSFPKLKTPHLLKEAANFPDPTIIDTVLSLGFVNPENILTFVSYLPDLESAQNKLCELLMATRLGLQNISQPSLERAVRSLEETIEGLKILAFQGS